MERVGLDFTPAAEHPPIVGQVGATFDPPIPELELTPTLIPQTILTPGDAPHLAWPLRMTTAGSLKVVAQDSLADVQQCVHILLRTPLGYRPLAPDVGVPDPTFTDGINATALAARLMHERNGEPRADVTVDAPPPDATGGQPVRIRVRLADPDVFGDPDLQEDR
jgi:phage baseplate assembly protein W